MSDRDGPSASSGAAPRRSGIEEFVDGPTRELADWDWLWRGDHPFPLRSHRPFVGRLVVLLKRLARPLVRAATSDLWERQRAYNLVLISHLEELYLLRERFDKLGRELQQVQRELVRDLRELQQDHLRDVSGIADRLAELAEAQRDIVRHHDALFARLDQKLDRLKRLA